MDHVFGIDVLAFIKTVGLLGVFFLIFAESGLLVGFFLPGDSLLFTAGFLASQRYLNIWLLLIGSFIAAVVGDNVGYAIGHRVGPRVFKRDESFLFNPANLARARRFYDRYGASAIVLARFMPAIRTFAPVLAGVAAMPYARFFSYNIIGGALWAVGLPLLGFFLGSFIPGIDRYIIPIVTFIIIVSTLPSLLAVFRGRRT